MPLSTAERKHRMPFGAQRAIAAEEGVAESYVSAVVADELRPKTPAAKSRLRRVRVAVARKLRMRVDEVFPADPLDGPAVDRIGRASKPERLRQAIPA